MSRLKTTEAPHTIKGKRQSYKDVAFFVCILHSLLFSGASSAFASGKERTLPNEIRKVVLDKHLKHLRPYETCVSKVVQRTKIPEMLLLSILMQENGRVGAYSVNRNATRDYGVSQINDVRKDELAAIGLSLNEVMNDGCKGIIAMAYLLSNEYQKADGNMWLAVGNYHYSRYGKNPEYHFRYIRNVHNNWKRLYTTVKDTLTTK